jgi:hypothetical protein
MEEKRKLYMQGIDNTDAYLEFDVPLEVAIAVNVLLGAEELVYIERSNPFASKDIQGELL